MSSLNMTQISSGRVLPQNVWLVCRSPQWARRCKVSFLGFLFGLALFGALSPAATWFDRQQGQRLSMIQRGFQRVLQPRHSMLVRCLRIDPLNFSGKFFVEEFFCDCSYVHPHASGKDARMTEFFWFM